MAVKLADDIVAEIRERGNITVPEGYCTGEDFERYLRRHCPAEVENIKIKKGE